VKLVGIGDPFIHYEQIRKCFAPFKQRGVQVKGLNWALSGYQELQNINSLIEMHGCKEYDPPEYIYKAVRDADIIVTQFCPLTKKLIDRCGNLKIIGVLRGGVDNVDVKHATEKTVLVYNTPGRNSDSVADFTIGMMICECRNIARGHLGLKEGQWLREYPNSGSIPDLPGKTVGIIGLGEIGKKIARRLIGFDVKLLGYDPFVKNPPHGLEMVELDRLFAQSDIITIHVRLDKSTDGLINSDLIKRMKSSAYLINTSRSRLVDEDALYEALRNRRIAGAALDVFSIEPTGKDYPLVALDNVTVTPHMAGASNDSYSNSPYLLANEMITIWDGKISHFIVNKQIFGEVAEYFTY